MASNLPRKYKKTNIPYRTIVYNLKNLRDTGTVEHKKSNGRPSKVTQSVARAVGQHVRRNNSISTRQLASAIQKTQNISISYAAIWRHMKKKEYESSIPRAAPMLTSQHIELRKAWALAHLSDNWDRNIFTDETAFDLFRNKVRRWNKSGNKPIRRLPKSHQKVMAWGAFPEREKHLYFASQILWMGHFM
jgi:hypothetical protein